MSTPEGQAAPQMPTPQDAQAIFDRASQAAQRAETAAQRLEAAQTAAGEETSSRFPQMPREVLEAVSRATAEQVVTALNAQYELAARPAPAGEASGASQPAGGASGSSAAPTGASSPDSGSTDSEPPGFRNLAHRILGY